MTPTPQRLTLTQAAADAPQIDLHMHGPAVRLLPTDDVRRVAAWHGACRVVAINAAARLATLQRYLSRTPSQHYASRRAQLRAPDKRLYPVYMPGMSTREYVQAYELQNAPYNSGDTGGGSDWCTAWLRADPTDPTSRLQPCTVQRTTPAQASFWGDLNASPAALYEGGATDYEPELTTEADEAPQPAPAAAPATWTNGAPVTYAQAIAAGQDAGNRAARRAGRAEWGPDDWAAAADVVARMLGRRPAPPPPPCSGVQPPPPPPCSGVQAPPPRPAPQTHRSPHDRQPLQMAAQVAPGRSHQHLAPRHRPGRAMRAHRQGLQPERTADHHGTGTPARPAQCTGHGAPPTARSRAAASPTTRPRGPKCKTLTPPKHPSAAGLPPARHSAALKGHASGATPCARLAICTSRQTSRHRRLRPWPNCGARASPLTKPSAGPWSPLPPPPPCRGVQAPPPPPGSGVRK